LFLLFKGGDSNKNVKIGQSHLRKKVSRIIGPDSSDLHESFLT
jgi:hypothetical protein